jgi:hypothetical protein
MGEFALVLNGLKDEKKLKKYGPLKTFLPT